MEPQVLDVDGRAQPNRLHEERLSHAVDLADRHVERSETAQVDPPASPLADHLADELANLPQALEIEPEERDSDEDRKEEELRPAQVLPVEAIGIEDALVTRKEVIRPRAEDIAHDGAAIPPQGLEDIVAEGLANVLVAFDRRTEEVERGEGGGRELGHELVVARREARRPSPGTFLEESGQPLPSAIRRKMHPPERDAHRVVLEDELRRLDRQAFGDETEPEVRSEGEDASSLERETFEAPKLLDARAERLHANVLYGEIAEKLDGRLVVRAIEDRPVEKVAIEESDRRPILAEVREPRIAADVSSRDASGLVA